MSGSSLQPSHRFCGCLAFEPFQYDDPGSFLLSERLRDFQLVSFEFGRATADTYLGTKQRSCIMNKQKIEYFNQNSISLESGSWEEGEIWIDLISTGWYGAFHGCTIVLSSLFVVE
jgi:hypothetical protein